MTSGCWYCIRSPHPPNATTPFFVSPPPNEVSEGSKREEEQERLPLVQNLQEWDGGKKKREKGVKKTLRPGEEGELGGKG